MTEILPCWKCGSSAHMLPTIDARVMIACPESGLGAEHGAWVIEDTEEQAIAAWNTRAERTCRMEQIPECCYDDIECSVCGVGLWGFQMDIEGLGLLSRPNYCPNCGAKVVDE